MKTQDLVLVSLFAALIVVLSLVPPIPMPGLPVPITLQSLGVMLTGAMLGPLRGGLACLLYLALAAIGLPVLPGGRGGLGVFFGPTGGFLIGMALGAVVTGWLARCLVKNVNQSFRAVLSYVVACVAGGIGAVYLIGVPWLSWVAQMELSKAALAVLVFIPGDLVKVAAASWVAWRVERVWPVLRESP
jgi:biotin transport system substrate-specific component